MAAHTYDAVSPLSCVTTSGQLITPFSYNYSAMHNAVVKYHTHTPPLEKTQRKPAETSTHIQTPRYVVGLAVGLVVVTKLAVATVAPGVRLEGTHGCRADAPAQPLCPNTTRKRKHTPRPRP